MKESEKVDAMMLVPAPMLADALSEFLLCNMIPALGGDEEAIARKKQYWEPMIKIFSSGTMEDHVAAFQYETQEQRNAFVREMEEKEQTYIGFTPPQFEYIINYLSEHMPHGAEMCEWQKPAK